MDRRGLGGERVVQGGGRDLLGREEVEWREEVKGRERERNAGGGRELPIREEVSGENTSRGTRVV